MSLNSDHIDYIIKDLNYRGLVVPEIQDELIDHVCCATEERMQKGQKFLDAYEEVVKEFGSTQGLYETQHQTILSENKTPTNMLRNYFTIAFRNLRKQGFYSIINIAGLAIGVAACLIIILFVMDELSYDKYNLKADRIFRLNNEIKFGGNHYRMTYSCAPAANALQQDYPEVEATVRFRNSGTYLIKAGNGTENVKEERVIWADSTFFKIFSVNVLQGDAHTALKEPASIAISQKMADKYFLNKNALGESLILDNEYNAKVTAVYADMPKASHFHFDFIISMVGDWPVAQEAKSPVFLSNNFITYLLLKEGTNAKALEAKFPQFLEKYVGPQIARVLGGDFSMDKFLASGNKYEMTLTPLLDIHLNSDLTGEFEPNGSMTYVYLFATLAVFILGIACINFMNLSTARSANRAKEVGVRKVMGSLRLHLIRQFLTESTLLTFFSFIIAIAIAYLLLPVFNNLALKELHLPLGNIYFYAWLMAAALVVGVLAGIYPSFFLSAFKPVNVLKGHVSLGMKSGFIRSALVVFQFVISIVLIVGAITVNRQLSYIQNKKLGFNKDQVITIKDAYALSPNVQAFKNEVLKINSIESCSISGFLPVEGSDVSRNDNSYWKEGNSPTTENLVGLQDWRVDFDYVKTMGMNILKGRDFSVKFPSDSSAVILNEAAVEQFELGSDPIGKKISTFNGQQPDGSPDPNQTKSWTVIGVVENFHFSSLKESISSLGLFIRRSNGFFILRIKASHAAETIQALEKTWKSMAPGQPFRYSFLDEDFGRMYAWEERLGQIFSLFAGLAIFIACLGLFALTAFTAEQRTKEIGIRKVLGASVTGIVLMLSKDFGKLVIVAFVVAVPIAWYGVDWWLKSYTYKTQIGIFIYLMAGVFAFAIAWLTMSYQSFRAAASNPVKSLRSE